jgi:hypothetical protein
MHFVLKNKYERVWWGWRVSWVDGVKTYTKLFHDRIIPNGNR